MATPRKDDIDYTAEGSTPPHENDDPTNEGYDEAAHTGRSRDVFGTTGGGTDGRGMHVDKDSE